MDGYSQTWISPRESTFVRLEGCLAAAGERCPVAAASQLRELLPVDSGGGRLLVVELIKFDMALAAQLGLNRDLDFYLPELEDLLPKADVPVDLILEAVQLRVEAGMEAAWDSYARQFPHLYDAIQNLAGSADVTMRGANVAPLPDLQVGDRINEFQILARLGQGAFARVFLARQDSMQRLVALKVTNRVSDEPQALSQLDHPNIVRVYDQRNCEEPRSTLLYMQFAPGGTLAECIRQARLRPRERWNGQLLLDAIDQALLRAGQSEADATETRRMLADSDWPTVVAWIGTQLADGLGYAHRRKVLHRDVKPANILLSSDGVPKLADFNVSFSGLAGRAGAAAHFGGSLAYMAPEQLEVADPTGTRKADELDNRADIYSLAVVLWEVLFGERPWHDDSNVEDWSSMVRSELKMRGKGLPSDSIASSAVERVLLQALRRGLSMNPDERPQTGEEFAGLLRMALYPEAAGMFFPDPANWKQRWLRWPPWVLIAATTFPSIVIAAVLNYFYNMRQIQDEFPELWNGFQRVSLLVNGIAFPIGFAWFGYLLWRFRRAITESREEIILNETNATRVWSLGHEIAIVCGFLWLLAGLAFPIALSGMHGRFPLSASISFFLSLVICGGIAMIYPFFGVSLLSLMAYYPRMVPQSFVDRGFVKRSQTLRRRARRYLFAAAAIPLLAMTLLVLRGGENPLMLLATIASTGLGFGAAYWAVQMIDETLDRLKLILDPDRGGRQFDTVRMSDAR